MSRVAVVGAGSWGTALALVLGRGGAHEVTLWAHRPEAAEALSRLRENRQYLPGFTLPPSVRATHDLAEALAGAGIVATVVPSHHVRDIYRRMAPWLHPEQIFVSATKGIEDGSHRRMSEVVDETLRAHAGFAPRVCVLGGPSFAREVARNDPTAVTVASADVELASLVQRTFGDPAFRVYTNDDVTGVELGGALKNVIAIAAGAIEGIGLGSNSMAALVTRGLAEITRLAVACGGRRETMAGLAGMGDLVLTCTGGLSRNRTVGVELGRGRRLDEIMRGMHGMVAEGVLTAHAALGLARRHGVELPITEQVHAVLHEGREPAEAIRELMARPGREE